MPIEAVPELHSAAQPTSELGSKAQLRSIDQLHYADDSDATPDTDDDDDDLPPPYEFAVGGEEGTKDEKPLKK